MNPYDISKKDIDMDKEDILPYGKMWEVVSFCYLEAIIVYAAMAIMLCRQNHYTIFNINL
jgi:hypothetical protein